MPIELIARETEIAELLAAVRDGGGVVLSGDAGVGKTALAKAVAQHVESLGQRVEWIVATSASRTVPFGALAHLLPEDVTSLHPALVLGAIARQLREPGARPTLVVVDDAHLLDDQSAATLLGVVSSRAARTLVTVRTGEPTPDPIRVLWKDDYVTGAAIEPFDRDGTQQFLAAMLGGEVAIGTAARLWQETRGNALYLAELARDAKAAKRLVNDGGVWIWRGDVAVPPRLAELLDRRFDGLSPGELDALGVLVMSEPVTVDLLASIVDHEAIGELERRLLVEASEHGGRVWYRFAHPLLSAAAERLVTPARRRRLADALVGSGVDHVDVVRRGAWQLEASGPPDVGLLLTAGRVALLTQPALARRFAERALIHDPGPAASLLLSDAHAEVGNVHEAHQAHALAVTRVRDDDDRLAAALTRISLVTFSDRRPDLAGAELGAIRADVPERFYPEVDSCFALVTLFAARPADALASAERVLANSPPRRPMIRANTVRTVALALGDRHQEALDSAKSLLDEVADGHATPYVQGMAHLAASIARHTLTNDSIVPTTDVSSGRWPVMMSAADLDERVEAISFPLFDGTRRLLEGHVDLAIPSLREALARQRSGEGLLRSEVVSLLIVALAANGDPEAEILLANQPPDHMAMYPGLLPWAEGAVAAAAGRPSAIDLALDAAEAARSVGGVISAVGYLADAARYGAPGRAAAELDRVGQSFCTPLTAARALGIRAMATGDGKALLEAAESHAELGYPAPAASLADLAAADFGRNHASGRDRALSLVREMRRRLRQADTSPAPIVPLTRRELEVGRLAAKGMSDRDIAGVLVVSVRTVESHLASAYRKLDIGSRQGLRGALLATA